MKIWNSRLSDLDIGEKETDLITSDDSFTVSVLCLQPGQTEKRHVHRIRNELIIILSGKTDFIVNQVRYTLEAGQMIYLETGDIHYQENVYSDEAKMLLIKTKLNINDYTELE